jgi:hypothetical protein
MEPITLVLPPFWTGFCAGNMFGIGLLIIVAYVASKRKRR